MPDFSRAIQIEWRWTPRRVLTVLVFLAAVTLPFTRDFTGETLYPFKLIVPVGLFVLVLRDRRLGLGGSLSQHWLVVLSLWVVIGSAGLFRTPSVADGTDELAAIAFGALLVLYVNHVQTRDLRIGWLYAFGLCALVAAWEIATGNHLHSVFADGVGRSLTSRYVISTFANPNNYSAFLYYAAWPLAEVLLGSGHRRWTRIVAGIFLIAEPILILQSGSRSGLLAFGLAIISIALIGSGRLRRRAVRIGIAGAFLLTMLLVSTADYLRAKLLFGVKALLTAGSFDPLRSELALEGAKMMISSSGMGVGPGGYEATLTRTHGPVGTELVVNPHGLLVEIGSQYGLVVVFLVCAVAIELVYRGAANRGRDPLGVMWAGSVVGFVAVSVAASSLLNDIASWLYLATVIRRLEWPEAGNDYTGSLLPESRDRELRVRTG